MVAGGAGTVVAVRWVLAGAQVVGGISVVAGAAMMYLPAAFVIAGLGVVLWAQGMLQEAEDDEDTA